MKNNDKTTINDKNSEKIGTNCAIICALIVFFVFMYTYTETHFLSTIPNIGAYVVGIGFSVLVFGLFWGVLNKKKIILELIDNILFSPNQRLLSLLLLCTILASLCIILIDVFFDLSRAFMKIYNFELPFFSYILVVLLCLLFVVSAQKMNINIKLLRRFVDVLLLGICLYMIYGVNYLGDSYSGAYHIQAYVSSIISKVNGYPYRLETSGIYGHYAIFYFGPVRFLMLFFSQWHAIIICIAVVGAISYLFTFRVLDLVIKNDVIYYISLISVCSFSLSKSGNYYQLFPHRVLFPILILYIIIKQIKIEKNYVRYIGYILSVLSIIWNLETGIVCAIVWALFEAFYNYKKKHNTVSGVFFKALFLPISSFVNAYLIVLLFNIVLNGEIIDLKLFIYPILSKEYHVVDDLQRSLNGPFSYYFVVLCIFLVEFFQFISALLSNKITSRRLYLALVSVMGLGLFMYYINLPVNDNLRIVLIPVVLVCSISVDGYKVKEEHLSISRFGLEYIHYVILCCFALSSIFLFPGNVVLSSCTIHDTKAINNMIYEFSVKVPENTAFVGYCGDLIASSLNKNNNIEQGDWPDISSAGKKFVYDLIEKENIEYIFVDIDNMDEVLYYFHNSEIVETFDYVGVFEKSGPFVLISLE